MDEITETTEKKQEQEPKAQKTEVKLVPMKVPDAPRFDNHFTVEVPYSIFYGKMLSGDFHQVKLSIGAAGRVGVEAARLNAGTIPDRDTDFLHYKIAMCKLAFKKVPEWFQDVEGFMDIDVLDRIYREVVRFEGSFRYMARE